MRILFVTHQFFPEFSGGTERVTLQLARMLQHAGHAVRVLTCRAAPAQHDWREESLIPEAWNYVHEGVPVTALARHRLPAAGEFGFDVVPAVADELTAWLRREHFHVAHVFHTMRMATAVMAMQIVQLPYVVTLTDFFLACHQINLVNVRGNACDGPQQGQRCARDCLVGIWTKNDLVTRYEQAQGLLASAALRCVPSKFVQQRAQDAFPQHAFHVVAHGLDLIRMQLPSVILREQTRPTRLVLAFVGTLIAQKGVHVLIEALALLPEAEVELRIIGPRHGDNSYHQRIDGLIAADRRVKCLGQMGQKELFAALVECDLLCLPSLVPESFSLTYHEAAALGLPALVANHGAPASFVQQSGAGLCVAPGSASEWAQAIGQVLDNPQLIETWRRHLFMPARIEEEAFFYESLYRTVAQLE